MPNSKSNNKIKNKKQNTWKKKSKLKIFNIAYIKLRIKLNLGIKS